MKMRRLLSVLLALAMVLSILSVGIVATSAAQADTADTAADINIAGAGSAYEDMLAQTTVENNYGLSKTVNDGTILQAWTWSFKNIESNLETIAEQGFTTIQVSPPNEIKKGTKGAKFLQNDGQNGWWMFYQPAGFQLNNSTDNALGTKAEFVSMCEKAHELGLKVIVDAVINHMGTKEGDDNNTSEDPMSHVTPKAKDFEPEIYNNKLFHSPWKKMQYIESNNTYYNSAYDLTRNCTSGLPDLKTEDTRVQTAIYDYMKELVEAGADGFRFDAAKHIETPDDHDGLGSSFWTNTLKKVQSQYSDKEIYAYGEILNTCGISRPYSWYTKLFDVTDSGSYWQIKNAVIGEYSGNPIPYYPSSNFTAANTMLWDESHDTYIDGATTSLSTVQRGKIWALVAGRAGISSVYLARPSDSTNKNDLYNITLGEARKTSWSNATTKAINQFHNYFIGQSEYCSNSNGTAYIERGTTGAMIVNLGGTTAKNVTLTNHKLTAGTYKDAITGNTFTVTKSQIKGSVGSTGVAVLYENNEAPKPTDPPAPTDPPETYILGDADGDGTVSSRDAVIVMRSSVGEADLTEKQQLAADVDGDGYVTVIDATWIQRYIAKKPVKYDIGKEKTVQPVQPTTPTPIIIPTTPYEEPTQPDPEQGGTIIFSNNKGFSTVNIYYWSDADQPVEWPGVPMTSIGMNEYGEERFTFDIPAGMTNYIINDGSQQTVDVPFYGSTGVYMTDQDAEGHYNVEFYDIDPNPTPTPGPDPDPDTEGSFLLTDNFGWGQAYVYAWDDDGNELYGAWPGSAQAETTQNEYGETQFRCYIPKGATGVILSNGNGEQTEDIKDFSYDGYWMDGSKNDLGHYKVTGWNSDGSGGSDDPTPDYPVKSSFLLTDNFGWGQAYVYAWNEAGEAITGEWPGSAMAETVKNDYGETQFKCNVPENAVGVILSNGNGAQTEDITDFTYDGYWMNGSQNDKGHYLVTGWRSDGSGSGGSDQPIPTPDPTNRTIIFSNNKGFSSVNIYYWSENEMPVEWPGVAMTSIGQNEFGEERFTFELPEGMTNYIITDGSSQTVDIPFTGATGVYMTDLNGEGKYEVDFYAISGENPTPDPTTAPAPVGDDGIYLVGTFSGWETNAQYKMSENPGAAGEYMISTTLTEGDGVKVVKVENGTQTWYPDGMDNEYIVDAAHAGNVTVYFNPSKNAEWSILEGYIYIDNGGVTPDPQPTQGGDTPDPTNRTIIFSNNKGFSTVNIYYWSESDQPVEWPGVPMTYYDTNEMGEQRYSFEMPAGMTNYIINDGTQQTIDITFTGATGVYMTDKDSTGNYNVEFYDIGGVNPTPEPTTAPTPEPTTAPTPVGNDGVYLVGTFSGWETDAQYKMSENPGAAGEYMISTTLTEGDGVKVVKVENGTQTWYPDGMDNEYIVDAAHAGNVTVYFNPSKNAEWSILEGYIYIDNGGVTPDPQPTQGGDTPDPTNRTIIFSNNKGFSTVNIYYWSESDQPVEWPGVPMTYYDTNEMGEQRYSFEMPAGMTNYIINDGTQQTIDITFTGATGVYMTDKDSTGNYNVEFYDIGGVNPTPEPTTAPTPEPTTAPTPVGNDGVYLVGTFSGWETNAQYKMSENPGAAGEYMISTTLTEGNGVKVVKVENGTTTWYPDGEGNEYTVDAAHAGNVTVYFNAAGSADWSAFGGYMYIDNGSTPTPDPDPTQPVNPDPDVQGGTIIFSNNKSFSTVNIYYWSESDKPVEWPGVPMTYFDTNEMGEQRYSFEMPEGMTNYIINDGTQQTVDIPFTGSTGVYMTDKDGEGHYMVDFYEIGDNPTPNPDPDPDPTPSGKDVTFEPGDAAQSDPAWFAWVWNDGSEGTWIQGTVSGSNVIFAGAAEYGNILVVRMPTGSTSADWDTCWNQSEDVKMQSGTLYFTGWGSGNKFTIGWK